MSLFARLFLLFALVPLCELAVLVWLTRVTSLWVTLCLVLTTGLLGATLTRWQGLKAWNAVRTEMAAGRLPAAAVLDGVMILVAGALLLTPGLLTDIAGFCLLAPPLRAFVRRRLTLHVQHRISTRARQMAGRGTVVETEARRVDPKVIDQG